MEYQSEGLKILALLREQVMDFNHHQSRLIRQLGLNDQELFNPDFLREINEQFILPRIDEHSPQNFYYYTKWLAIDTKINRVVADFLIKQGPTAYGEIEIGYGSYPEFEGKGYMTRIIALFIAWARTDPGISLITAETDKQNLGSIRVLSKNGFSLQRETEEHYYWQLKL